MLNRREVLQSLAAVAATSTWKLSAASASKRMTAHAFDAEGRPAGSDYLKSLLLFNADGKPWELLPQAKGDGTLTIDLPSEAFEFSMLLPVKDFGEVYLYADGVSGPDVVLNYEFARSRAAFV